MNHDADATVTEEHVKKATSLLVYYIIKGRRLFFLETLLQGGAARVVYDYWLKLTDKIHATGALLLACTSTTPWNNHWGLCIPEVDSFLPWQP